MKRKQRSAKRIRDRFDRRMLRPLIYKVFTRGILALTAIKLWQHFIKNEYTSGSDLSFAAAIIFALAAVIAYLRLDGLAIPQFKLPRRKRIQPGFERGDIADHIDDRIVLFDDLDDDEQAFCVFICDLLLLVLFLTVSLFKVT